MVGMWAPPSCVGQEPKEMNDVGGAHKDEHYFLDSPTGFIVLPSWTGGNLSKWRRRPK